MKKINITIMALCAMSFVPFKVYAKNIGNSSVLANAVHGSLNSAFGKNGILSTPIYVQAMALDPKGNIVVAGTIDQYNGIVVMRYLSNGAADTSFNGGNAVQTQFGQTGYSSPTGVIIDPTSGKITIIGNTVPTDQQSIMAVARYNSDGSPDLTFAKVGYLNYGVSPVQYDSLMDAASLPTGGLVAVGNSMPGPGFSRFLAVTFDSNGNVVKSTVEAPTSSGRESNTFYGVFVLKSVSDYRIVANGISDIENIDGTRFTKTVLNTYNSNLSLTTSQSNQGTTADGWYNSKPALSGNGQTLALVGANVINQNAEDPGKMFLARKQTISAGFTINPKGTVTSNKINGDAEAFSAAFDSSGMLVVSGQTLIGSNPAGVVTRYLTSGKVDKNFGKKGVVTLKQMTAATNALITPAGKILVVGFDAAGNPGSMIVSLNP